jgi:ElaB/YqjD/DUF883 family membrane-anchored ribosome-binding protein
MSTTDTPSNGNAEADIRKADVRTTTDAAAKMAHDLVDRVARVARESEERIRQTASSAESSLQQTLSSARVKAGEAGDSVTDFVRQHPFAALGIAFGTGVLLSYLTRSRARHDSIE